LLDAERVGQANSRSRCDRGPIHATR
jgi:hypothetical protein